MYAGAFEVEVPERWDPWLALAYLKWRERTEASRERRGGGSPPPGTASPP